MDGLLAEREVTYGTDPTPTAADNGVRVSERFWSSLTPTHQFVNLREDVASGTLLGVSPAAKRGRIVDMDIAVELRGAGAAYSATVLPEMDPLFGACGLVRTDDFTVSAENVSYAQADTAHVSCTIYAYAAQKEYRITGCRGTFSWLLDAGVLNIFRFRMRGILAVAPTEVTLPSITYDTVIPPPAVGLSFTVGSWSPDHVTAELRQEAAVQTLISGNATDGIDEIAISRANPRFTLTARTVPIATYDPYADARAATLRAIDATLGSTQYNRVKLDINNAYVMDPGPAVDQEFTAYDLEYLLTDFAVLFD